MTSDPPHAIVDRQILAYNARDIDAYCQLFSADAVLRTLNTEAVVARGIVEIRAHYNKRFANKNLYAEIKARIKVGSFVIDHEIVTGIADQPIEVLGVYEVRDGLIRTLGLLWP